jgi:DNA-binding response OmpR family regulator
MRAILVIDDELVIANMLQIALEDEGYQAIVAHNGKAGLESAREVRPDLVLLDFMMPIMDGPATLAALRADEALSTVPVIIMSSIDERTVSSAMSGYQRFIRKPFRIDFLIEVIGQILGSEHSAT